MSNANRMVMELLRLGAYLQREGTRMSRKFGLTQQQFVVLVAVKEHGPLSQKDILSDLLYEKSNVSKCISRLVSLGMVEVSRKEEDSRVVMCEATEEGRNTVDMCMKTMKSWNETWLQQITSNDLKQVVNILGKIGQNK